MSQTPISDRLHHAIHRLENDGFEVHAVWLGAQKRRDLADEIFTATGSDNVLQSFMGRKILVDFYDRNKATIVVEAPYLVEETHDGES